MPVAEPMKKADPSKPFSSPPPLPASPPPRGDALARLRAFLAIRRIRVEAWVRNRPALAATLGAVVVLAIVAGVYVAKEGVPEVDVELFAPKTVAEARQAVREHPSDATNHRALGHQLWAHRKRHAALLAYGRALAIDRNVADDELVTNLVASFGGKDQELAETLLWKNKLAAAQPRLEPLVKSPRRKVRWGAVHTLDKLEKGTKANWETAYILDLDAKDCDVRRNAVEKLGAIGTKRAVTALRAAQADDEKTGGWFRPRCLGDRLGDAEQKILARR
jgi:hypothetical protein